MECCHRPLKCNPENLQTPLEGLADFKAALQESAIAIWVDVHDWALLPASFHRNIEQAYVELQSGAGRE